MVKEPGTNSEEYFEGEIFGQKIKAGGATGSIPEIFKWLLVIGSVAWFGYSMWDINRDIKANLHDYGRQLRNHNAITTYHNHKQEYSQQLDICIRSLNEKYTREEFQKIIESWDSRSRKYYCPYIVDEPKFPTLE